MTDKEIIKALKDKINGSDYQCFEDDDVLDLINRQQAEIERLKKKEIVIDDFCRRLCRLGMTNGNLIASLEDLRNYNQKEKSEAIKEIAERLKEKSFETIRNYGLTKDVVEVSTINNLLKEMVGEEE